MIGWTGALQYALCQVRVEERIVISFRSFNRWLRDQGFTSKSSFKVETGFVEVLEFSRSRLFFFFDVTFLAYFVKLAARVNTFLDASTLSSSSGI